MKKLITLLFAATVSLCAMSQTEIRTAQELANIDLSGDYILMNDFTLANWQPIANGDKKNDFVGKFNGNGHTITIVSFNNTAYLLGVFGSIGKKGVVKNLRVVGDITIEKDETFQFGGIAGYSKGSIQNCMSDVGITAQGGSSKVAAERILDGKFVGIFVGGIVGHNTGLVENCYSIGSIVANGKGNKFAGGIAAANGGSISHCFVSGSVSAVGDGADRYAGGIVGGDNADGRIEYCVALNDIITVIGKADAKAFIGTGILSGGSTVNIEHNFCGPIEGGNIDQRNVTKRVYYRDDIKLISKKAEEKESEKNREWTLGLPKSAKVSVATMQARQWWDGSLNNNFSFPFGTNETAPWQWDEANKGPILYWEKSVAVATPVTKTTSVTNQVTESSASTTSPDAANTVQSHTDTQTAKSDVITKKNGDQINAKVLEIGNDEVKYKKFGNENGPTYTISKSEIFTIKYANGSKDVF
ncbi:hypothetical protein FACS1894180_7240 [Bacteroidia bacterium]|nr:hypothetical protein FACS1894178_4600 [Bacteroidia bacterium]GHV45094.1 hypothetical protein FACS1894180_7240 [Bacteroidia bacterium]